MTEKDLIVPGERIERAILLIRGKKVILDTDLAAVYGIQTFRFNEAVKRNRDRFPSDFMFQLSTDEFTTLISQNAMSKSGRGGRRTLPYAFTEHGAVMAANILKNPRAVQMSVFVVRAFIGMRQMLGTHKELKKKIEAMEMKYDQQFSIVFDAIKQLVETESKAKKKIGFEIKEGKTHYSRKQGKN